MALQVIDVGTSPNDGQGDPIRTAFIKSNDNFAEIYSRAQTSPPATLIGSAGDQAGMYAYDSTYFYYCFADYDGSSTIWAQVTQVGNIAVSSIASGNSEATFDDIGGNLVIDIHGTSNVAVFRSSGFFTSSNITASNVNATQLYGPLATAAQPNVTSVGTLTGLNLSGLLTSSANLSTTGNVIGGNLVATNTVISNNDLSAVGNVNGTNIIASTSLQTVGTVSATGNIVTDGYFVGTFVGNVTGNFVVPGSNTQVLFNNNGNADASPNFKFDWATNVLQVTGNVSTGNLLATTSSAAGNVTGGNLLTGGIMSAAGNVAGGNIDTGGTVNATGTVTGGNLLTGGIMSAAGNITSAANISGGNLLVTTTISATSHIGSVVSVSGNVTGGNVIGGGVSAVSNVTGANLNISSTASVVSNITGGNILTGGLISATGNITGNYILGNGSLLTGIDATSIQNGTSSVAVIASGGNVRTNIAGATVSTVYSDGVNVTGAISASGNITGGNVLGGANVNATTHTGTTVSVTGAITGDAITGSSLTVTTGNITGGNIINGGANNTGNIGSSTTRFNNVFAATFNGLATSAEYADLAEKYVTDALYEPGTVVVIGGSAEVTASTQDADRAVAGVISSQPAHIMNSKLDGEYVATVALIGRVPCRVTGTVARGDLLVSTADGRAKADNDPKVGTVIGKALESFDGDKGTIEIIIGKL